MRSSLTAAGYSSRPGPGPAFDTVIATRDAAAWVFLISRHLRRLGLRPVYFVDRRSTRTFQAATRILLGSRPITSEVPRVEGMLASMAQESRAKWIFRLDDDEVPSGELVEWLTAFLPSAPRCIVGIPRCPVFIEDGVAKQATVLPGVAESRDYQYRVFPREGTKFTTAIHTPGILLDGEVVQLAPDECRIFHMDWLVRSQWERQQEVAAYDRQRQDAGSTFRRFIVPEEGGLAAFGLVPVQSPEVRRLAVAIYLRRRVRRAMQRVGSMLSRPLRRAWP